MVLFFTNPASLQGLCLLLEMNFLLTEISAAMIRWEPPLHQVSSSQQITALTFHFHSWKGWISSWGDSYFHEPLAAMCTEENVQNIACSLERKNRHKKAFLCLFHMELLKV